MADTQKFLNFKMGLYENLASTNKSAGTVYVTTDERAMYVDISDTERIRLQGSVLYYNTLQQFIDEVAPPYSTDIIYFIAADNALVRWDGKEWIQLNLPAKTIEDAINQLTNAVTKNAEDIAANKTSIEANADAIAANAEDIKALQDAIGGGDAEGTVLDRIDTLEGEMDTAQEDIGTLKTDVGTLKGSMTNVQKDIGDLQTSVGANADSITAVSGRVTTLEGEMDISGLKTRVGTAESNITQLQKDVEANDEAIGVNAGNITTLQGKMTTAETNISNINTTIGADDNSGLRKRIKDAEGDITALEGRMTTAEGNISGTQRDLDTLEESFETYQNTVSNTYVTKAVYNERVTAVDGRLNGIDIAIGDDNTASSIKGRITALEGDVSTAKSNISKLQTDVSNNNSAIEGLGDRVTTLEGEMDAAQQAISDHGTRLQSVESLANNNKSRLDAHDGSLNTLNNGLQAANKTIGENTAAIEAVNGRVDTEKGRIDGLNTRMGTAEGKITTAEGKITTAEGKITTLEGKMTTAESNIKTLQGNIVDINTTIETLATKKEVEDVEDALMDNINDHIKAANAMTYKGAVNGDTATLPTTGVKVGDTYVVTKAFSTYLPGDLLIATGTETGEGDDAVITSGLKWDHVVTGYSSHLEPSMAAENNTIQLKNYAGADLGGVALTSGNAENLKISTVDEGEIKITLEWGSF